MNDPHEIARKLSALRTKILERYTQEELEALHNDLVNFDLPWVDYALQMIPNDFPTQKILAKKKLSTEGERLQLFFQTIVLQVAVAVFGSADNFFPGLSDYEIPEIVQRRIKIATDKENLWPFSDLVEKPWVTRKKLRGGKKESPQSTPQE